MEAMFDIFATLPDGSPLWLEAVEGLEEARRRLRGLAQAGPGNYFIYSEKSGGVVERTSRNPHTPMFHEPSVTEVSAPSSRKCAVTGRVCA